MKRILAFGAVTLGVLGVLATPVAVGLGWWAASRTTARATLIAARLDEALADAGTRLERIDGHIVALRAELAESRGEAEKLEGETSELAQVRTRIDQLA